MSHRPNKATNKEGKKKGMRKADKAEQIIEEPYVLEDGPSRLILRNGELYNGWEGPCGKCKVHIKTERPAAEGLRCPECDIMLFRPGTTLEREEEIGHMRELRDGSSIGGKKTIRPNEGDMLEMLTGLCHICGGEMELTEDEFGAMFLCPHCTKHPPKD